MNLHTVVVLAAGEGTRMKSSTPKVLHSVAGRSLLGHVLHAVSALNPAQIRVVVGSGREQVEAHIAEIAPTASTVFQEHRGGTGHATQLALAGITPAGTILVLAGDTPMLTSESLAELVQGHSDGGFSASVLTSEHPEPTAVVEQHGRPRQPVTADEAAQIAHQRHGEGGREYRGLRTKQHTYVRGLDGPWLLFDNIADR